MTVPLWSSSKSSGNAQVSPKTLNNIKLYQKIDRSFDPDVIIEA
ncbi:hypothetical protein [Octadecabacter antarcticus]|nr:hypothetical protein [Octadecabacter antarcticus]